MHGLSETTMSNTINNFLFLIPFFVLLIIFYYSSFLHQNSINFSVQPNKKLPPSSNLLLNISTQIQDEQHVHNNISYLTPSSTPEIAPIALPCKRAISPTSDEVKSIMFEVVKEEKKQRKKSSVERIEHVLARSRVAIRDAIRTKDYTSDKQETFVPRGPIYKNSYAFHQSYIEMEKNLKIWTYKEGNVPLVHEGQLNGLYAIEGHFIEEIEGIGMSLNTFKAEHPNEAQVFFLPFSIAKMVDTFYRPLISFDRGPIYRVLLDYINVVAMKYPYWNRSQGADHFMLSCHDWGPDISKANPKMFNNLIRALCNANLSEGFQPIRDVSIPEVNINFRTLGPPSLGLRISKRRIFAFFAGRRNHGHVRKFLFKHWKDKYDDEIQVHEYLSKNQNYFKLLGQSKFCLCPSGYEVASPRIVEAIHAECVPVIIKDNYSFPFNDVLDWTKFSIHIPVSKIPEIKVILKGISTKKYLRLVMGVRSVKQHFTLNRPSKPFDLIHMILHSIWLRRLNIQLPL